MLDILAMILAMAPFQIYNRLSITNELIQLLCTISKRELNTINFYYFLMSKILFGYLVMNILYHHLDNF